MVILSEARIPKDSCRPYMTILADSTERGQFYKKIFAQFSNGVNSLHVIIARINSFRQDSLLKILTELESLDLLISQVIVLINCSNQMFHNLMMSL